MIRLGEVDAMATGTVILEHPTDDRPDDRDMDSVAAFTEETGRELDSDVLQGLRELQGADGIRWSVHRVGDDDPKRNGFLMKLGTSQLNMEYLTKTFGGGRYYVRGNYPSGKYAAHRTIEIAADAQRAVAPVAANPAASGQPFDVQRFLAEQEALSEARAAKRRTQWLETITVLGPIVGPIIAAMVGNRGPDVAALVTALKPPPAPTMPEMMTALASLKSLAPEQTTDPVDRALKLFDVIADRTPSGGETGWADILKEAIRAVAPSVAPMIEAKLSERALAASMPQPVSAVPALSSMPGSTVAPVTQTGVLPAAAVSVENPMLGMVALLPWLKSQLQMALTKAANGTDPVFIADRILDDANTERLNVPELLQFVARPDWFVLLCRFEPRCAQYQSWFTDMRNAMLEEDQSAGGGGISPPLPVATQTPPPAESMSVQGEGVQTIDRPGAPPSLTGK